MFETSYFVEMKYPAEDRRPRGIEFGIYAKLFEKYKILHRDLFLHDNDLADKKKNIQKNGQTNRKTGK